MTFESLVIDTRLYYDIPAYSTVFRLFWLPFLRGWLPRRKIVVDKLSEFDKGKLAHCIDMGMLINDMASEIDRNKVSIVRW